MSVSALSVEAFNQSLIQFLDESPTPFHATQSMKSALLDAGFEAIQMAESWQLKPGGRYVVCQNDSSLIAFTLGASLSSGFAMVGAHTDSPCLKLKPNAVYTQKGYIQLGVETYGGVLQSTWFDRDLSLAGRVSGIDSDGNLAHVLVDFKAPIAVIPSLAIHLDREANSKRSINAQTDLPPIMLCGDEAPQWPDLLLKQCDGELNSVLDFELMLYDTQGAALVGLKEEFIASARLDNLLSCYTGLQAMCGAVNTNALLICSDHEEVGSDSVAGAGGPFLEQLLKRLAPDPETYAQMIDASMMISADNAHGIHPNFPHKHDARHGPVINQGPVIKVNANQRYASNSETVARFKMLCQQADIASQNFVSRTDMGCGSTIGPITATRIGVKTLDVGLPTFAMHSIRELAGTQDAHQLYRVLRLHFGL